MPALRPATDGDRAFCRDLHRQTMREYVAATWGWDEEGQRQRFDAAFNPSTLQVIEVDALPVGMLGVDATGGVVRLLTIAVAPSHQRQGLGTWAVEQVIAQAHGRPVWLQVLKVNPARALYRRHGFVVAGETTTHWQMLRPADAAVRG